MAKKIEYPKLPPVFKAKWIEALKSGKWKKGKNYLQTNTNSGDTFCCLGVACKIQHPKLDIEASWFIEEGVAESATKVPKLLKGDTDNLVVLKLSNMNDSGKYSFKQIANWIEKNL